MSRHARRRSVQPFPLGDDCQPEASAGPDRIEATPTATAQSGSIPERPDPLALAGAGDGPAGEGPRNQSDTLAREGMPETTHGVLQLAPCCSRRHPQDNGTASDSGAGTSRSGGDSTEARPRSGGDDFRLAVGLTTPALCPECACPVDTVGRCWRCRDRPCVDCGQLTGSAFILRCVPCGLRFNDPPMTRQSESR